MSTEFSCVGSLTGLNGKNNDRAKCVEAALILVNTALSENTGIFSDILEEDLISKVADKIESAFKNVE